MTNDALINGSVQILSDKEREAAEEFHKKRVPFAWVDGQLKFNTDPNDDRDHQHWLLDDFGISVEIFERLNRGYMIAGRIQLFKGSRFEPINTDDISVSDFNELLHQQYMMFGTQQTKVCNGVKVGKVGEVWDPIFVMGVYNTIV